MGLDCSCLYRSTLNVLFVEQWFRFPAMQIDFRRSAVASCR